MQMDRKRGWRAGGVAIEKKRGRGWLVLTGSIALVLYAGAYYAMVRPVPSGGDLIDVYGPQPYSWEVQRLAIRIFGPIHQVDRRLRPRYWNPPPPQLPNPN